MTEELDAPPPRPTYHALGTGALFCRLCLTTVVPEPPTPRDPLGVRLHEAANIFRHKEYRRREDDANRPRVD